MYCSFSSVSVSLTILRQQHETSLHLLLYKDKCEDIFRDLLNNLDNDSDDEQESTTYENFLRVKL